MRPRVWVYTICKNESRMMPFFLRHYSTFAEKIIVYDEQSDDGTRELVKACPRAELREWTQKGLDDEKFLEKINRVGPAIDGLADWIIFADVDELLYHPNILRVLAEAKEDMIASTGYALISPTGFPTNDGRQLYEIVKTGVRQSNYDKFSCWRPTVSVQHTIGRHTYGDIWPKCDGVRGTVAKLKLFHCHHVGGVEYTREINQRNFTRAVDKKFAWNYTPENNRAAQVGTVAWVQAAIELEKLVDVVSDSAMRKMQFGCGSNRLEGWDNFDAEIDLRKSLPFPDDCASFVFAEHVIEHVTHKQAWLFLAECWRVLAPGGVVRIAIPDICRMAKRMTPEYAAAAVKAGGHGDGSPQSAIKAAVFEHGHQAAWTAKLLAAFLEAIGFKTTLCEIGESSYPELRGIEGHGKVVGDAIARVETGVVEGVKA